MRSSAKIVAAVISDNLPVLSFIKRAVTGLFMLVLSTASPARAAASVWASAPKPDFPKAELSKGTESYVVVSAYLNATGAVTRVAIAKSSGHPVLDETARTAVSKWRMKAGNVKPEYATNGYQVRFDFRPETLVAARYRDRSGYFSTYKSAEMWKYVTIPEYPIHELGERATGTTKVGVTIDPGGEVTGAEVVKTSGYPNLDKAAVAAVRLWRAHEQYAGKRFVVPVVFEPRALRRR